MSTVVYEQVVVALISLLVWSLTDFAAASNCIEHVKCELATLSKRRDLPDFTELASLR